MKFRYKVTICMISLIALIFGIGGTALLYVSFQNSVESEKSLAAKSFNMVIRTMSIMSQTSTWTTTNEISSDFAKIIDQNDIFSSVSLHKNGELIYRSNESVNFSDEVTYSIDNGTVLYKIINQNGQHYIQLASVLEVGSLDLYMDAFYDITRIYEQRREQQRLYQLIFLFVVLCSAFFSYVLSYILTKPISRLKRTAGQIADGNYAIRSYVNTNDEIGELSAEFNHMADALVDKMEELNAAMERQKQFIGNFTHELKTPMTSMIGYADLLRRQTLTEEEQIDAANYIFSESKRLERLSIKMLELIVAEDDKKELTLQNPSYLVEFLVKHYAPYLHKSGIELETSCEAGKCRLEPDYFVSLLVNLLENARRSMEKGGIIQIHLTMTEDGCMLSVEDSGCGIPEDKLTHITEAFYRVDKARSRAFGGAGLGLSLCDRIAKRHNGNMSIESKVGVGTRVLVWLRGGRE